MILLLLVAAALLISIVTAMLGHGKLGQHAGWFAGAGLAVCAALMARQPVGTAVDLPWLPTIGPSLALRLDGLGLLFALIVLVVGALVLSYSASYLAKGRHGTFLGLLTFFAAAMLLLVLADDIVLFWAGWELTTVCSFLLISQTGPKGREPAMRTFIVTAAGGLCLLGALALMWAVTGSTRISQIVTSTRWEQQPALAGTAAVLVILAGTTKSAQFPFHSWLPDAMVASTPVSAYLHAAAMVKAGIFLLLRFSPLFAGIPVWHGWLVVVGLATATFGAMTALKRFDLKEMLAYSTLSQLGFLVALIGVGTTVALVAAVVHVLAHALFKSALFMTVGMIDHECRTRDFRRLSGLRHSMPITSTLLVLAAASMAGLPPLFGFVSKEALFLGATTAAHTVPGGRVAQSFVMALLVLAAAFTFAYSARMVLGTLPGNPMDRQPHEASAQMWLPVAVAVLAGVVLGVAGPLAEPLLSRAAQVAAGPDVHANLGLWHGVTAPLVMTIIAIGLGLILTLLRGPVSDALARVVSPVRATGVVDGFRFAMVRLGRLVGSGTRYDGIYRHLLPVAAVLGVLFVGMTLPVARRMPLSWGHPVDWAVLAMVAAAVALTARARSRVGLVSTVGVVGFALALLYFMLGAPDVALTQLLVETLTVVMMVMLLVRLPYGFHSTSARRSRVTILVSILVAVGGYCLALAIQFTQPSEPPLGHWFLTHGPELTGGRNVVNTMLVEFRAMDTLGEMTALGVAGIALKVTLESRGLLPLARNPIVVKKDDPAVHTTDNMTTLRVVDMVLGPLLAMSALWFYLRGHNDPGGGFIAALVASAGIALIYLASPDREVRRLRGRSSALIGSGMLIAVTIGLLGFVKGAFLHPFALDLGPVHIASSLMFDLGVFLTVLGLVLAAVGRLGIQGRDESAPIRRRRRVGVLMEDD